MANSDGAHYARRCGCREDGAQLGTKCPKLSNPRHGTWSVYVNAPATHTDQRQRIRKGGFASKAAAQEWAKPYLRAAIDGQRLMPTRQTLATFMPEFIERRTTGRKPLSASTLDTYRIYADVIAGHAVASIPLTELRRRHVQQFVDEIAKTRGASAVDKIATLLQSVLRAADDDELTIGNPAARLHLPEIEKADKVILTAEQTATLLPLLGENSPQMQHVAEVALWTGMRIGEIVGLRWEDIDGDVLSVRQTLVSVRGHISIGKGKTAAARRQVALGPLVLKTLTRQRALQNRARLRAGSAWDDQGLVFATEIGTPIDPKYPTKRLTIVERRAGLPLMTMHGFRHLHVTHLDSVGTPSQIIKQRVGHSASGDITEGVYTHRAVDAQRPWAASAERIVGDIASTQAPDLSILAPITGMERARNYATSA